MKRFGLCLVLAVAVAVCPARADRRSAQRDQWVQRGQAALRDNMVALSARYLERALELSPTPDERREILRDLAAALIRLDRVADARLHIATGLADSRTDEQRIEFLLLQAQAHRTHSLEEALASLREAMTLAPPDLPAHASALRLLGLTCLQADRLPEAEDAFRRFAEAWPTHPEAGRNRLDWASALSRQGRFDEAEFLLRGAMAAPEDPMAARLARIRLADVLLAARKTAEARVVVKDLKSLENIRPEERAEIWIFQSRIEQADGDILRAAEAIKKAMEEPLSPETRHSLALQRGRLLVEGGNLETGQAVIREAVLQAPERENSARTQLFLARHLAGLEQWNSALREYLRFLETFPGHAGTTDALRERAICLFRLGRHAEAAAEFDRVFGLLPESSNHRRAVLRGAADARFLLGETDAAIRGYRRVIALDPNSEENAECEFQIAEALRQAERLDAARTEFEAFLERYPLHPLREQAHLRLGMIEERREQWDAAAAQYGLLLDLFPDGEQRGRATLNRGLILYRLGQFEAALADFEAAARDHAQSDIVEQALFMQGWCHALLGRTPEALALCEKFIAEFPNSRWTPDVQFWIGETHFNLGDFKAAEAAFETLSRGAPQGTLADRALFWAGRAAMRDKEPMRAIEHFNRLARDYPASSLRQDTRFHQGEALRELGQFAKAILAYQEILLHHPDSHLADTARLRIGDCHYTLAAEDPSRYEQAILSYRSLRDSLKASPDMLMEAEFKIGRCLDRLGRRDEAIESFMNVVYSHEEALRRGHSGSDRWFAQAALAAAARFEEKGGWKEAGALYRKIVESGSASAPAAQARLSRIRFEPWRNLQGALP